MLPSARVQGNVGAVKVLLQAGRISPDSLTTVVTAPRSHEAQSSEHETALHVAAKVGHEAVVHALLREGADPNIANLHGDTPLHCACRRNHLRTVKRLVSAGAKSTTPNKAGETPVAQAELPLRLLLETGALRLIPAELLPIGLLGDSTFAPS